MTGSGDGRRGDALVAALLAGDEGLRHEPLGDHANDLLDEVLNGYPVERLRPMAHSANDVAIGAVAFLCAELGEEARPLVGDLIHLMDSESALVRHDVCDTVLLAATPDHGQAVARAVHLVEDIHHGVRSAAVRLLGKIDARTLAAAQEFIGRGSVSDQLDWLLEDGAARDADELLRRFTDPDPLTRRVAVAAAFRIAETDPGPTEWVAANGDTAFGPDDFSHIASNVIWTIGRKSPFGLSLDATGKMSPRVFRAVQEVVDRATHPNDTESP